MASLFLHEIFTVVMEFKMSTLLQDQVLLLVIDIQGKLAHAMFQKESLFEATKRALRASKALRIPIVCTEQYPKGLGPTVEEIAEELGAIPRFSKTSFSCLGCEEISRSIMDLKRRQILVSGIESHICVYQTTRDLLREGYEVHLLCDAISSRLPENKIVGLKRAQQEGAVLSSVEMALFEIMGGAEYPAFKDVVQIVK